MGLRTTRTILRGLLFIFTWSLLTFLSSRLSFTTVNISIAQNSSNTFQHYDVDCSAIYHMDPVEIEKALALKKQFVDKTDGSLINATSDCERFLESRGYKDICISQEEKDFPIAYSLVVHTNAWYVERLIRAIYSPSNIFCIHYDLKSSDEFRSAIEGLARCLPNVMISTKKEYVVYASMRRLKADLHCISDLLKSEVQWKYIINLCGKDFPLRSNIELVSELKKLNGGNMMETQRPTSIKRVRFTYQHVLSGKNEHEKSIHINANVKKDPPPHGIEMFTGNAYFVLSRAFIEFMNSSDVVRDFQEWCEDTWSPDEHFWGTLARLPGIPGEIPRSDPDITDLMSKTRLVKWSYLEGSLYPPCTGIHVRAVCIYGLKEMNWLLNYGHWFANKVDPTVDPVIIQCLEETLLKRKILLMSHDSLVCY